MIGHASVLIETDSIGILSDPWTCGSAFNDGWLPYPEPILSSVVLERASYLWISHEHPDHFSIPTLQSIPEERRKHITVLFQRHYKSDVRDFLSSLGFRDVQELEHGRWLQLSGRTEICCRQVGHTDSLLVIREGSRCIVNLNDCVMPGSTLRKLKAELGEIDLLLRQFTYADWVGNPDETERMNRAKEKVLENVAQEINVLAPRAFIPFASFMRWAHQENTHQNKAMATVEEVAARSRSARVITLAPGDQWEVGTKADSSRAAQQFYAQARARLAEEPLITSEPILLEQLVEATKAQVERLRRSYPLAVCKWVPPVRFFINDYGELIEVSLTDGVRLMTGTEESSQVSISSQAMWYTFAFRWGLPTLGVSARYRLHGDETAFRRLKKVGSAYSAGLTIPRRGEGQDAWTARTAQFAWKRRRDLGSQFLARVLKVGND
jgi:hypothetical protein